MQKDYLYSSCTVKPGFYPINLFVPQGELLWARQRIYGMASPPLFGRSLIVANTER